MSNDGLSNGAMGDMPVRAERSAGRVVALADGYQAQRDKIGADARLTPAAKAADLQALAEKEHGDLPGVRDAAMQEIEGYLTALDGAEDKTQRAARPDPDWQQAYYRKPFIDDDFGSADIRAALDGMRRAHRAGDHTAVYLIERATRQRIKNAVDAAGSTEQKMNDSRDMTDVDRLIGELYPVDNARLSAIKNTRRALAEVRGVLGNIRSERERGELAARYGLDPRYVR